MIVTQGPKRLLRHILRFPATPTNLPGSGWTSSRQIPIRVLRVRETPFVAWLLQDDETAVLVFEVDDLMVHIAGPPDYLKNELPNQLQTLVWSLVP